MVDKAKREIAQYIAKRDDILYYCAEDIVDHIQAVITDTLAGESDYSCCNAVMRDYGLPLDWLWDFIYDEQNDKD